jgi:hypothetical protein
MPKLRKLGEILLDMEPLLDELAHTHELQWGDILALIHSHLVVHAPSSREEYLDGTHPEFFYGSRK